jgi:predicted nucleotidyltransferase
MVTTDPTIVQRLRNGLDQLYGTRIEHLILFGSRARGDARAESDYDVALFLRDLGPDIWDDLGRIAQVTQPILEEAGIVINVLPIGADKYTKATPLMGEIYRDGVEL